MDIQKILDEFSLGIVESSQKLDGGKVNKSFLVNTTQGKYIVQNLAPAIPPEASDRYARVQSMLRTSDIPVPVLLKTTDGKIHLEDESGHWRAFEYVPHDENYDKQSAVESVASTLAKFHNTLQGDFPSLLENFHNFSHYVEQLESYDPGEFAAEYTALLTTHTYLPDAPTKVLHGDPKLANFLFENNRVKAMLDLDTIMNGNILVDLGDGLRSWCRDGSLFDKELFDSAIEAYNRASQTPITREDAVAATKHITRELGIRYLTDCYEESYFDWDNDRYSSSAEHNLFRAREMIGYLQNIH